MLLFGECERSGVCISKCDSVLDNGILLQIYAIFYGHLPIVKDYVDRQRSDFRELYL